jgi:hypothetical protein
VPDVPSRVIRAVPDVPSRVIRAVPEVPNRVVATVPDVPSRVIRAVPEVPNRATRAGCGLSRRAARARCGLRGRARARCGLRRRVIGTVPGVNDRVVRTAIRTGRSRKARHNQRHGTATQYACDCRAGSQRLNPAVLGPSHRLGLPCLGFVRSLRLVEPSRRAMDSVDRTLVLVPGQRIDQPLQMLEIVDEVEEVDEKVRR